MENIQADNPLWAPRRALTLGAAQRHTRIVKLARAILLCLAALILGILAFYFLQPAEAVRPMESPDESVRMTNPIFKGRNEDGTPYRLEAKSAVQKFDTPDLVALDSPVLNFFRVPGADESNVVANIGQFDKANNILTLNGAVTLKTDDGYFCHSEHAVIYMKAKRIEGDQPIDCDGPFGTAWGKAYEINDNYTEFVFKNGMNARLVQGQPQ